MDWHIALNQVIGGHQDYPAIMKVLHSQSQGRVWLIGGMVYRHLANILYGGESFKVDWDFIVEGYHPRSPPLGWQQTTNHFGNPKLRRGHLTIDIVPLNRVQSIVDRGLSPTIDNFLKGTPLDIQSIAYDLKSNLIAGEAGRVALIKRQVAVNNLEQARLLSVKYGISISDYLIQKAESLGFTPILRKNR